MKGQILSIKQIIWFVGVIDTFFIQLHRFRIDSGGFDRHEIGVFFDTWSTTRNACGLHYRKRNSKFFVLYFENVLKQTFSTVERIQLDFVLLKTTPKVKT